MDSSLALAFELLTLTAPAAAEPRAEPATSSVAKPAPPPASPRLESRWYGWQTLATDGAAITLLATAGLLSEAEAPDALAITGSTLGLLSYALGGPFVHFAHRNPGRGFASLGLRVGVPIVTALTTMGVYCSQAPGEYCGLIGLPVGAIAILTAIAVDAAALAYDEVPVESARNQRSHVLPVVAVTRHGASLGLALTL